MGWKQRFDDPVSLPAGGMLLTLEDAAGYIQRLPKAEQRKLHWQTAISILIGAAEGRDFMMHARIGLLTALYHDAPPPEKLPRRKAAKQYRIIGSTR